MDESGRVESDIRDDGNGRAQWDLYYCVDQWHETQGRLAVQVMCK